MQPSSEELKKMMRAKSDMELYSLLHVHSQDYTLYALGIAEAEFNRRQLDEQAMRQMVAASARGSEEKAGGTKEAAREPVSDTKERARGWSRLILLIFAGYALYGGDEWLDSIGWISHQENTSISARSDWLVGESKECRSATLDGDGAALTGKKVGYAMSAVSCDDGPEHKMEVTFYGRIEQLDHKLVKWRCTKGYLGFTCWQTGAE